MRALGSALTLTAVAVITVSTPAWAQPATPKIASTIKAAPAIAA